MIWLCICLDIEFIGFSLVLDVLLVREMIEQFVQVFFGKFVFLLMLEEWFMMVYVGFWDIFVDLYLVSWFLVDIWFCNEFCVCVVYVGCCQGWLLYYVLEVEWLCVFYLLWFVMFVIDLGK